VAAVSMPVLHGNGTGAARAVLQVKVGWQFLRTPSMKFAGRDSNSLFTVLTFICVGFHPSIISWSIPVHVRCSRTAADTPDIEDTHRTAINAYISHAPIAESADYWAKGSTRDRSRRPAHSFRGGIDARRDGDVAEFRVCLRARE
jgi:hypothetical protein